MTILFFEIDPLLFDSPMLCQKDNVSIFEFFEYTCWHNLADFNRFLFDQQRNVSLLGNKIEVIVQITFRFKRIDVNRCQCLIDVLDENLEIVY